MRASLQKLFSKCPVSAERAKKYGKWIIVFYCVKGTAVTVAALAAGAAIF